MKQSYQEISSVEAVKLLAASGVPLKGYAFRDHRDSKWDLGTLSGSSFTGERRFERAYADTPGAVTFHRFCARVVEVPVLAAGHNPDNLTESQVGVKDVRRLLSPEEIFLRHLAPGVEYWSSNEWYSIPGVWGSSPFISYRTKKPTGYFLPKPKVTIKKVTPWTFETAPKGHVLLSAAEGYATLILGWNAHGVRYVDCELVTYNDLACQHRHSLDGGKTWSPCGVETEVEA